MNENRLDQILIRLGYINEEQIKKALQKQRTCGGRIGTHLLNNKDIDEVQLAEALSIQHQVTAFDPAQHPIAEEFVKTLPSDLIAKNEVLPIDYDAGSGILTMVVTDPKNEKSLAEVKRVIKCTKIRMLVTPEAMFANLVTALGHETEIDGPHRMVKLPDLFDQPDKALVQLEAQPLEPAEDKKLTEGTYGQQRGVFEKLPRTHFEREGLELVAPSDGNEIREHLNAGRIRKVLVARELSQDIRHWCRHRSPSLPGLDITEFTGISDTLLDNLAPYTEMYKSLTQSLKIITEAHASQAAFTPPYDLLREDIRSLARTLEMNRLVIDALQLAALLIVPTKTSVATKNFMSSPEDDFAGIDWHRTLEQAKFLQFPWPIDDAIRAFREILSERVNLKEFGDRDPEMALAAQIMAIVWYHFYGVSRGPFIQTVTP